MGIDPYGDFAWSPFVARICFCILHGRGRTPPAQDAITKSHNERRQRNMSVGVDAHIDPAAGNRKIAPTIGDHAQRPVGADASVRPLGNCKFAATFRQIGRAPYGSMWASTPTNVMRIRRGTFGFAGVYRRADRVVRPYGCIPFRIGAFQIYDGVPRGRGRTPPLRKFDALVQTHPRPAPREIPRRGRSPFLVGQRIAKGRFETPLGCLSLHRQRRFLSTRKERGAEPPPLHRAA